MANGSRGAISALDPHARTLTIRLDGSDGRTAIRPGPIWTVEEGERNRRVDLAYATTGHRAQGLTRGRALVRLTGTEDVKWLYGQLSRARQETRLYAVVGSQGPDHLPILGAEVSVGFQPAVAAVLVLAQLPRPADRLAHAGDAERLGQQGVLVAGQADGLQLRQPRAQAGRGGDVGQHPDQQVLDQLEAADGPAGPNGWRS